MAFSEEIPRHSSPTAERRDRSLRERHDSGTAARNSCPKGARLAGACDDCFCSVDLSYPAPIFGYRLLGISARPPRKKAKKPVWSQLRKACDRCTSKKVRARSSSEVMARDRGDRPSLGRERGRAFPTVMNHNPASSSANLVRGARCWIVVKRVPKKGREGSSGSDPLPAAGL